MSMFANYENESYTAYNLTSETKEFNIVHQYMSSPIIGYDKYNNIKCFIWDSEDEFILPLRLGTQISVFEDSILYEKEGDFPTDYTVGSVGQRAYNLVDGVSWVCKGIAKKNKIDSNGWIELKESLSGTDKSLDWTPIQIRKLMQQRRTITQYESLSKPIYDYYDTDRYIWELDTLLTYPLGASKKVTVVPNMENSTFRVTIMNFRHEVIYTYDFNESAEALIEINKKDTPLLVQGQFFINTYIVRENSTQQISQYNVTILENPNKYIQDLNSAKYITGYTIQPDRSNAEYIWHPLGKTLPDDYLWIQIGDKDVDTLTPPWVQI